jgi:hypothetical protein
MGTPSTTLLRRVTRARNFPFNTDAATRHVELIGRNLVKGRPYPMLHEEPQHCGESLLCTVALVYELRSALAALHDVCTRMDLENQLARPSEAEYQRAMARAGAMVPGVIDNAEAAA